MRDVRHGVEMGMGLGLGRSPRLALPCSGCGVGGWMYTVGVVCFLLNDQNLHARMGALDCRRRRRGWGWGGGGG